MVFSYGQLCKEELRVDSSTFEFDEAPVDAACAIQARTLAQMLDAIESIKDFT